MLTGTNQPPRRERRRISCANRTSTAPSPEVQARLRSDLTRWAGRANDAGLDVETMVGMLRSVVNETSHGAVA